MAKIMAVDDSSSMRNMVAVTLQSDGHEVISVADGEQAYQIATQRQVELVITDLYMPKIDGINLVKKLRQLDHYRFIPLLFLTTESSARVKKIGKEVGATGWIVKPFLPEQLLATVKKLL